MARLKARGLALATVACSLALASAQTDPGQIAGTWIPTDLNNAVIQNLNNHNVFDNVTTQIQGWSTLGMVTVAEVASFIQQLNANPTFRDATVRWQPGVPSKCLSGVVGCTHSIKVTALEYEYVSINATDCKTQILVAADAILPPTSILTDSSGVTTFLPKGYPVQYEVVAAPNATSTDCIYVVQYPQATQKLANTLCTANSSSGICTNSPCQPCNANQTVVDSDPPTNCTAASGVAPALVAAIEGAAQCLSLGGVGPLQCQVAYIANNSACSQLHCFPGDALVNLEGARSKRMEEVKIGDRVQVVRADGSLAYDDVYFFGHRAKSTPAEYLRLTLGSSGSSVDQKVLEMSRRHFLPASRNLGASWGEARQHRAQDIQVGDRVWAAGPAGLQPMQVQAVDVVVKQGLWNPYTLSGSIVVNNVAASAHSEWIFDGAFDLIGRPDLLPAFYQVLFAPFRLLYHVIGAEAAQALDNLFNFGKLATARPLSWALTQAS